MSSEIDKIKIEKAVAMIIEAIGDDITREGLVDTPRRIAEMYEEIFGGVHDDPAKVLDVGFDEEHREMVILRDIPFYSMCEHHFMPFFGTVDIGYIPNGRVVGVSKLARVVEIIAKKPQLQERLTSEIAETIMNALKPEGVAVVVQAEHLCMTMRGIKKPGSNFVTSANRGIFRNKAATRAEFLSLIRSK
jgi:GTP cyclohydrolase I